MLRLSTWRRHPPSPSGSSRKNSSSGPTLELRPSSGELLGRAAHEPAHVGRLRSSASLEIGQAGRDVRLPRELAQGREVGSGDHVRIARLAADDRGVGEVGPHHRLAEVEAAAVRRLELGYRNVLAALDPVQVGVGDPDGADRGRERVAGGPRPPLRPTWQRVGFTCGVRSRRVGWSASGFPTLDNVPILSPACDPAMAHQASNRLMAATRGLAPSACSTSGSTPSARQPFRVLACPLSGHLRSRLRVELEPERRAENERGRPRRRPCDRPRRRGAGEAGRSDSEATVRGAPGREHWCRLASSRSPAAPRARPNRPRRRPAPARRSRVRARVPRGQGRDGETRSPIRSRVARLGRPACVRSRASRSSRSRRDLPAARRARCDGSRARSPRASSHSPRIPGGPLSPCCSTSPGSRSPPMCRA